MLTGTDDTIASETLPALVPDSPQGVSLLAIPHSITFPDQPGLSASTSLAYIQAPPLMDVDYGSIADGQFLGPLWKEVRYFSFYETVPAEDEMVPVLGPLRSPKIEGRDAFQAQTGVGLHPTISWSPPRLGSATSYTVTLFAATGNPAINNVSLTVFGVTSVQIPPGLLQPGATYAVTITANSAPWDSLDRPPFRTGVPSTGSDCLTAVFAL